METKDLKFHLTFNERVENLEIIYNDNSYKFKREISYDRENNIEEVTFTPMQDDTPEEVITQAETDYAVEFITE